MRATTNVLSTEFSSYNDRQSLLVYQLQEHSIRSARLSSFYVLFISRATFKYYKSSLYPIIMKVCESKCSFRRKLSALQHIRGRPIHAGQSVQISAKGERYAALIDGDGCCLLYSIPKGPFDRVHTVVALSLAERGEPLNVRRMSWWRWVPISRYITAAPFFVKLNTMRT